MNQLRHQIGGAVRLLNRDLGIQSHASSAGELARVGEVPTYSIYSLLIITSYPGREIKLTGLNVTYFSVYEFLNVVFHLKLLNVND